MATDQTSGSKEEAAHKLMDLIWRREADNNAEIKSNPRRYFMTLYSQCLDVVDRGDVGKILGK